MYNYFSDSIYSKLGLAGVLGCIDHEAVVVLFNSLDGVDYFLLNF